MNKYFKNEISYDLYARGGIEKLIEYYNSCKYYMSFNSLARADMRAIKEDISNLPLEYQLYFELETN